MTDLIEPDAAIIVETATNAAEPFEIHDGGGELIGLAARSGANLNVTDLRGLFDRYKATPERATGTHVTATVQSFVDVTRRHESVGDGDTLTVWVHPTSGAVIAVLNDHGRGQAAQWGDHRVKLDLLKTEEWNRWKSLDGTLSASPRSSPASSTSAPPGSGCGRAHDRPARPAPGRAARAPERAARARRRADPRALPRQPGRHSSTLRWAPPGRPREPGARPWPPGCWRR
jgi:hypothetical protein